MLLRSRNIGLVVHNSRGSGSLDNDRFLLFIRRLNFICSITSTLGPCRQSLAIISEMRGDFPQFTYSTGISITLLKLESVFLSPRVFHSQLLPISAYLRPLSSATSPAATERKPPSTPAWRLRNSAHCRVEQRCSPSEEPWKA